MIEIGGNYSLSHEHKAEIQVNFRKSTNQLISHVLYKNKGGS